MRQAERKRVVAEVAELLAADSFPMTNSTLENEVFRYTDPTYTQRELDSVFVANPRVIAVSGQVPEAGDFFADDVSGEPLVIMRSRDGVVRGFYNVCVHRGTKVVCEESGNRQRHVCPFHGWVYDAEGQLRAVANDEAFPDLGEGRQGLVHVPVLERHGLIWQLPEGWSETDLVASLGDLDDELASYAADDMVLDRTAVIEQPVNWKFAMDGFLETYHFKYLHGDTIGPFVRSNFGLTDEFGSHTRMVVLRGTFDPDALLADEAADPMPHMAVAYQLFPNTVLVWQGTHIEIWTSYPTNAAPDRCSIRVTVVKPAPAAGGPELDWDRNWAILMGTVLEEDFEVSRRAQAGYTTGAVKSVVYGRNEPALQAFHRHLAAQVPSGAGPTPPIP